MRRTTTTARGARTPAASWLRFAQRLRDRLATVRGPTSQPDRVFRRLAAWLAVDRRSWASVTVVLAPRLDLRVGRLLREREVRAAAAPSAPVVLAAPPAPRALAAPAPRARPAGLALPSLVLARAPGGAPPAGRAPPLGRALARAADPAELRWRPAAPAGPSAERLLARAAAMEALATRRARREDSPPAARPALLAREAAPAPDEAGRRARAGEQAPRAGRTAAAASLAPGVAGLDLEQLTERVVRQLDARLVAHRERLGRAF